MCDTAFKHEGEHSSLFQTKRRWKRFSLRALYITIPVQYDLAALKREWDRDELARRPSGLWRYRELLPVVDPAFRVELGAGGTRLVPLTRIAEAVEGLRFLMKVEGSNPTGSFKDRPIGVGASDALEQGGRGLACPTPG